jgi:hypothetical protein
MKKITLSLLLFTVFPALAQTFEWVKTPPITFSMNADRISYASAADAFGNVYFAGYKENQFPYTDIFGNVYFNKYNSGGTLLFNKTLEGNVTVYSMTTDAMGNVLMIAGYVNTINLGTIAFSTVNQDVETLLLKYSPDGDLLWYKQPDIVDSFPGYFRTVATDASGNVYLGYNDMWNSSYIRKLDPQGNTLLNVQQENVRNITSVSVDSEGNMYTAGSCADFGATFAGVPKPTETGYNIYLVKYNAAGTFQWMKYVEDVTCPSPQVKAYSPDAVYFSSYLFGAFSFDGITPAGPSIGSFTDVFIAKLNHNGNYQWVREAPVPHTGSLEPGYRNSLDLDSQGNLYFAGRTRGTINWGNEILTSTTGFANDGIVLKYNPDGEVVMAVTSGGDSDDRLDGVAVSPDGSIYVSGMCNGNASFGPINHEAPQYAYYPFVGKISGGTLGTHPFAAPSIRLYPNPATDFLYAAGLPGNSGGTIFNVLGMKIKDFNAKENEAIDISNLAKGVYFVKIGKAPVAKIVKE